MNMAKIQKVIDSIPEREEEAGNDERRFYNIGYRDAILRVKQELLANEDSESVVVFNEGKCSILGDK